MRSGDDDDWLVLVRLLRRAFTLLAIGLGLHFLAVACPIAITLAHARWPTGTFWLWSLADSAAAVFAGVGLCRVEAALAQRRQPHARMWLLLASLLAAITLAWLALGRLGRVENVWLPALLTSLEWLRLAIVAVALVWLIDLGRRLKVMLNRPWQQTMMLHLAMAVVAASALIKLALLALGSVLVIVALSQGHDAPMLQWVRSHRAPFALMQCGVSVIWPIAALGVLVDGLRRLRRIDHGHCLRCGYDVRGDFDHGCPECGWRRANS